VVEVRTDRAGQADAVVVEAVSGDAVERITIRARVVVNATGVWADDVRALAEPQHPDSIRPAKGVHVTVPWAKVRNDIAVVIPVPKDKRSLFVVPWGPLPDGTFQHTYVGTTDTDYDGDVDDPQCTKDDLDYVLRALNASVTTGVTAADVTGVWAGLRPLVKSASSGRTADLSRRHSITTNAAGMISVAGGKLTTYREMAQDTVDDVAARVQISAKCRTKNFKLLGADGFRDPEPGADTHLALRYGTEAAAVRQLIDEDATLGQPLVPGLAYLRAEAVHAVRHEMAVTLDDVLSRRTRARLFDRQAAVEAADAVATLIGAELGWSGARTAEELDAFRASCANEVAQGCIESKGSG
ncbi:MAG: FAD-dependent oxidoreductase, partial [Ilumatobacteraceae bacterium]